MSNPPIPPYQQGYMQQQPTNGIGLAGFIVSLVGLPTCGLLSPVGLILSLVGLGKQPKGFAIAGSIIGAVGTLLLVVVGAGFVMAALGFGAAAREIANVVTTTSTASDANAAIVASQTAGGSLPSEAAGNVIAQKFIDAWQTPLRYKPSGESFKIVSAGIDKQFDTDDDLEFDRDTLTAAKQFNAPTTSPR